MMRRILPLTVAAIILLLYVGAIGFGLLMRHRALPWTQAGGFAKMAWRMGSITELDEARRADVEYGRRLFNETPVYGAGYTRSRVACASCHLGSGTAPYAAPVVGSNQAYPQFSKRAGRKVTLQDRIEECMTRSENGAPLPADGHEMKALLAYIQWLSEPHVDQAKFSGRGLWLLPALVPDPKRGAEIYAVQCVGCHGANGEGARRPYPPLWGPDSFNDGAGMDTLPKLTAFIHYNMPETRKGTLSAQDATDVAAFVKAQQRPKFNEAYAKF
jgi:thiosulfate dehydrogenase